MESLTVIAKIISVPGYKEIVKTELQKLIEPTLSEKGCINYKLYQDKSDENVLFFYENWKTGEDLDAHMKSEHFIKCFERIEGMFDIEVHKAISV